MTDRNYRFLFVTYRWGADLTGGAEIHHQRLVRDLLELGHEVQVWTTTGRGIDPVAHWGVEWEEGYPAGERDEDGVRVRRFPLAKTSRARIGLGAKLLERRAAKAGFPGAERLIVPWLEKSLPRLPLVHCFKGFHHPEREGDGIVRWTGRTFSLLTEPAAAGRIVLRGSAPQHTWVKLYAGGRWQPGFERVHGEFDIAFEVPERADAERLLRFAVKPFRPPRDHRTLGLRLRGIEWQPAGESPPVRADMWNGVRALGRRVPGTWREVLLEAARRRGALHGRLFDWLRGPRSPELARALTKPPQGFDGVIAANLPWGIIPLVARRCPLPVAAMPLWHVEDEYYYWPHYLEALRRARLVMANTPYAADNFFRPLGLNAHFVGPGVPTPPVEPSLSEDAFREQAGVSPNEKIILVVGRKEPEKRYDLAVEAVGHLREEGRSIRLVMIGPDADGAPLPEHVRYMGRVSDEVLDAAYRAAHAVVLMSETESFGLVLAEAWLRGRPVVASRACGPAASLVREGADGLLSDPNAESLRGTLANLLDYNGLAADMGAAGQERARTEFTQRAATERFLNAWARPETSSS